MLEVGGLHYYSCEGPSSDSRVVLTLLSCMCLVRDGLKDTNSRVSPKFCVASKLARASIPGIKIVQHHACLIPIGAPGIATSSAGQTFVVSSLSKKSVAPSLASVLVAPCSGVPHRSQQLLSSCS
jgi:hypothetical protein